MPKSTSRGSWELASVIRGEEVDKEFDPLQGGVRLAMENAIKVFGNVIHKPGSVEPRAKGLLRYSRLRETSKATVASYGVSIVCTGSGKEFFKPPGTGTVKEVYYAPLEAVKEALTTAGSTQSYSKLVVNFLGGDDLQLAEVIEGVQQLIGKLDVKQNTEVTFNSLGHKSVPLETATVTIVGLTEESSGEGKTGEEGSILQGEVYILDGKILTVVEEDLNDALS